MASFFTYKKDTLYAVLHVYTFAKHQTLKRNTKSDAHVI